MPEKSAGWLALAGIIGAVAGAAVSGVFNYLGKPAAEAGELIRRQLGDSFGDFFDFHMLLINSVLRASADFMSAIA